MIKTVISVNKEPAYIGMYYPGEQVTIHLCAEDGKHLSMFNLITIDFDGIFLDGAIGLGEEFNNIDLDSDLSLIINGVDLV